MLGVMCLVALLQLVRLFLLVLSVLVFPAYRLCVLMCAVCLNTPFIVGRGVVLFRRFDPVGSGISTFECYLDICVSEYVCDLAYLWGNDSKCCKDGLMLVN